MATCAFCGTTILFGGKKSGGIRFCSDKCRERGQLPALFSALSEVSAEIAHKHAESIHDGNCPKCGGQGPVDIHTSYEVWSAFIVTHWKEIPELCCRACGKKSSAISLGYCLPLGWWSTRGFILTPVQVTRNIIGLFRHPNPMKQSEELVSMARLDLARKVLQIREQGKEQR